MRSRAQPGRDTDSSAVGARYVTILREECRALGIRMFDLGQDGQGIVHIVGPELGLSLPGTTIVCGDSHTCTHGAVGALAFGIGSTELVHVLATQTIVQRKPLRMRANFEGNLGRGVTPKDLILHLIGRIGAAGGSGHAIEYARLDDSPPRPRSAHDDVQSLDRARLEDRNDRSR